MDRTRERHVILEITTAGVQSSLLAEYAGTPIAFEVTTALEAHGTGGNPRYILAERAVNRPYTKDYDAVGDRPRDWPTRFDTSGWMLFLAGDGQRCLGGATVACRTPRLDMLEGRSDLAVLWDIRVAPGYRHRGVGRALFAAVETWAGTLGCRELKVETQNINVAACRFYAAVGCELRSVRENAYPECPGESQFIWYKTLR